MNRFMGWVLGGAFVLFSVTAGLAQDLTVYDDTLQNNFQDWSWGGVAGDIDFASTAQVHSGANSISFIGDSFNAVSFAHPSLAFTTAQYPTVHFWVHGGAAGGQLLRIYLELNNVPVVNAPLDTYITGGSIAAGTWREVTVVLGQAPLSYSGSYDRIDLQSDIAGGQPVLYIDDVSLVAAGGPPPANLLQIDHDVTVGSMVSDRFTWHDAADQPRVAVLAHNDGQIGPGGTRGGELREFRYETPGGTRVVAASGGYASGFGYVVSHTAHEDQCVANPDTSLLGHFVAGGNYVRVFEGRHHAIFRFTLNYPRYCTATLPAQEYDVPVTIDWVFSTGRDNPLWAVTWDLSSVPADRLEDDSRAPYGELLFDGSATAAAHSVIAGVGWGDRYKFASTADPVTYNGAWTWNTANTIPYDKLWTTAVDATMGTVQTQTIIQQDAGGYWGTGRWNTTSGDGNACSADGEYLGAAAHLMPCSFNWPYQSINYSMGAACFCGGDDNTGANNTRLAWGTNFGFLGQSQYLIQGSASYGGPLPDTPAPGWPKKSYSTYVVLGTHSSGPVEAQVTQIETIQSLVLTATIGSVVTSGPAGVGRADTVTYDPAGYNPVYGALAFQASGNSLDANIAVGAGTLKHPLLILGSYTFSDLTVKLAGVTLVPDVDYFASLRPGASEVWITINRDLIGAVNHLEVLPSGPPPPPGLKFYTLASCRAIDTRRATGTYGGPALQGGTQRDFPLAGQCGIPAAATAISANLTVTSPSGSGDLRLFPSGTPTPAVSSINFNAGRTRANNTLLSVNGAPAGSLTVQCDLPGGTTHFLFDVNGYFAP
jgi:hypothetical protein